MKRPSTKKPSKFQQEMERERKAYTPNYAPTPEMRQKQEAYLKLLEDRKAGIAPMYVTSTGKVFK